MHFSFHLFIKNILVEKKNAQYSCYFNMQCKCYAYILLVNRANSVACMISHHESVF